MSDFIALKERFVEAKVRTEYARQHADRVAELAHAAEVKYAWAMRELEKAEVALEQSQKRTKWSLWKVL